MPRVKTAGRLARERLQAADVSETERIALLKIIAADERRKTNERIAKLGTPKRYTKKPKPVQSVEPTKTSSRNTAKPATWWTKDRPLAEVLAENAAAEAAESVVESVSVVEPESPAPVAKPAPAAPVLVEEFRY